MSRMMMRSDRKPPLPKSPVRLIRSKRVLKSAQNTTQYSHASLIKTPLANRSLNLDKMELRPEYQTISNEFQALAKIVRDEFKKPDLIKTYSDNPNGFVSNTMFERGRFYDEYSAIRNERLKRKRGQTEEQKEIKTVNDLGVRAGSANKKESNMSGKAKRTVLFTPMTENRGQNSRYMLRSMNKENKKSPLSVKYEGSAVGKSVTRKAQAAPGRGAAPSQGGVPSVRR